MITVNVLCCVIHLIVGFCTWYNNYVNRKKFTDITMVLPIINFNFSDIVIIIIAITGRSVFARISKRLDNSHENAKCFQVNFFVHWSLGLNRFD